MSYKTFDPALRQNKKRKKRIIVVSVVVAAVAVVCAAAGTVYIKQKNNINALKYAKDYTTDEIITKIQENDEETRQKVSQIAGKELRPLTEEESQLLQSGEISEEEALELISGDKTLEEIQNPPAIDESTELSEPEIDSAAGAAAKSDGGAPASEGGASDNAPESEPVSGGEAAKEEPSRVSSILSKVYLLKSEYTSSIDSLISEAKADAAGGLDGNRKIELMQKYTSRGTALESSCDARMDALISELSAELERTGGDKSVADDVRSAYESEKSLKKAELLSRYGG